VNRLKMKLSREQKRQLADAGRQLMEAAMSDPNPEYGCKIVWHNFWRNRRMVHVSGAERAAVEAEAIRCAINGGWTPPKWWQLWRLGDTRIEA
jgi:hypothetical protein